MDVIDRHIEEEVTASYKVRCVSADGAEVGENATVLVEHNLDVFVNEILTMRIVCTPNHLVDLVVGRLFSEGVIVGVGDVESVYLCEHGTRARVILRDRVADFSKTGVNTVPSCCTGNKSYNHYFDADDAPEKVVPIAWERSWVFAAARAFAQDSPLHKRTFGTHSCYVLIGGNIVCCREDLGRHNAFDKALGAALRTGVDLRQAMIFSSGRIPVDMVMKAIRAGVPMLVTKAVPTDATIELARAYNLTLICSARPDSMRVCHDPLAK
ncbi:formate dehydrogenase accessory sulfurtransferase FdhD [Adlercreutzia sp. ZJ141]|uniref:formate dehydrogenase accessory sulfurtransferase FdhD n=1 Tax=Adlercreutzia sp. ZJ141 TaxID=2709406 RepID=UPI0013EB0BAF|nr:formate dehydrogenase accessory sulfurtransferase FdhD [Adlercreutzia sp. ZJ141]